MAKNKNGDSEGSAGNGKFQTIFKDQILILI